MDVPYATRSAFLAACEDAVRQGREALEAGQPVEVVFEEGGYPGRVTVEIREHDDVTFGTDWESTDITRFPARIKAAATALKDCRCYGRYLIEHNAGAVTIRLA